MTQGQPQPLDLYAPSKPLTSTPPAPVASALGVLPDSWATLFDSSSLPASLAIGCQAESILVGTPIATDAKAHPARLPTCESCHKTLPVITAQKKVASGDRHKSAPALPPQRDQAQESATVLESDDESPHTQQNEEFLPHVLDCIVRPLPAAVDRDIRSMEVPVWTNKFAGDAGVVKDEFPPTVIQRGFDVPGGNKFGICGEKKINSILDRKGDPWWEYYRKQREARNPARSIFCICRGKRFS